MVDEIRSGMPAGLLTWVKWRKSARSGAFGNCVEVARLSGGEVAVRNSRCPHGPALIYPRAGAATFLAGVKGGEFDDFVC